MHCLSESSENISRARSHVGLEAMVLDSVNMQNKVILTKAVLMVLPEPQFPEL